MTAEAQIHSVTQFVEELPYKPAGRGFESWLYHWNFGRTIVMGWLRNEYQEYFLGCGKAAGA